MSGPDAIKHRVLMNLMERKNGSWRVSFLEADCRTALPRKFNFASPHNIRTMHRRFGASQSAGRQAGPRSRHQHRSGRCLAHPE